MRLAFMVLLALLSCSGVVFAQTPSSDDPPVTMFPHPDARYWVSGQMNFIFQAHPDFAAAYSGPNSLQNTSEHALSRVLTLYTGFEVTPSTELLFDVESSGGRGISDALGLAGMTNVDVVRNPDLGSTPYIARVMLHKTFALSGVTTEQERTPFALAGQVPAKRIEFRIGKFSAADFFDVNSVGSDSHLQFTNWTTVNDGAYDYAADTRGYTYGLIVEYQQPRFGVRFGELLMPKVANGIELDWHLPRAHSENLEFEVRPTIMRNRKTVVRGLWYWNTANMGDYREAVAAFQSGADSAPDVVAHRRQGTLKYGVSANMEQELPAGVRVFARGGWNEGRHESFAYTEVNHGFSFGADLNGERWHRKLDKIGTAFVISGVSPEHAEYLRMGGRGFLLGDGTLRYGRESISETYYNAHIWRGLFLAAQLQHVANPGYNRDRGPVWVPGARMHIDF